MHEGAVGNDDEIEGLGEGEAGHVRARATGGYRVVAGEGVEHRLGDVQSDDGLTSAGEWAGKTSAAASEFKNGTCRAVGEMRVERSVMWASAVEVRVEWGPRFKLRDDPIAGTRLDGGVFLKHFSCTYGYGTIAHNTHGLGEVIQESLKEMVSAPVCL